MGGATVVKVTVLCENVQGCDGACAEHGLSLFIEANGNRILFDMGQSGLFAKNAAFLGIDLSTVDAAVLSHGHYDHGGGIRTFLAINKSAPIYVHPLVFGEYYSGKEKYIGLDKSLYGCDRLIFTDRETKLFDGITIIAPNERELPSLDETHGLYMKVGNELLPDTFMHEQYLIIDDKDTKTVISGCSHRGIVNISEYFDVDVLIGGFHLKKLDVIKDSRMLSELADRLLLQKTKYLTCHCTGEAQYKYIKNRMGERVCYAACGDVIIIKEKNYAKL